MATIYSRPDILRKITNIKTNLRNDGFYDTKVVLRKKVVTENYDDPFETKETVAITDYIVDAIVEYGSEFVSYNRVVETFNGSAKMTVKSGDKFRVLSATEVWIGVEIYNNTKIIYSGTSMNFTMGTQYEIGSHKPSIYGLDEIFVIKEVGMLNEASKG